MSLSIVGATVCPCVIVSGTNCYIGQSGGTVYITQPVSIGQGMTVSGTATFLNGVNFSGQLDATFSGLVVPTSPPAIPVSGSVFFDVSGGGLTTYDGLRYIRSREQPQGLNEYLVYVSGSNFVMERVFDGSIVGTNTLQIDGLINSAITETSGKGAVFRMKQRTPGNVYTVANPLVVNSQNAPYYFLGLEQDNLMGVVIQANSSFPSSGRSIIEAVTSGASNYEPRLVVRNLYLNVGAVYTTKDVGGIRYETSRIQTNGLDLQHVTFNKCHRGLNIRGSLYWSVLENLFFTDSNDPLFSGTYDIKIERNGIFDIFKDNRVKDINVKHAGFQGNVLDLNGGYNTFYNIDIDGLNYGEAPIALRGAFSNKFYGIKVQDTNSGSTNVACILIQGTDESGNITGWDNRFRDAMPANYPVMYLLQSGANRNTLELSHFGGAPIVNDLGGSKNTFIVVEGHAASGTTSTKLVISGQNRVVDNRYGAQDQGSITMTSGATTVTVSGSLFGLVNTAYVTPQGDVSGCRIWVSNKVSGGFRINSSPAIPAATTFDWFASVY